MLKRTNKEGRQSLWGFPRPKITWKVTLNRDDDKKISKKDGISTFVRGHKDLSRSALFGVLSHI